MTVQFLRDKLRKTISVEVLKTYYWCKHHSVCPPAAEQLTVAKLISVRRNYLLTNLRYGNRSKRKNLRQETLSPYKFQIWEQI
jgi:hypothetical protein